MSNEGDNVDKRGIFRRMFFKDRITEGSFEACVVNADAILNREATLAEEQKRASGASIRKAILSIVEFAKDELPESLLLQRETENTGNYVLTKSLLRLNTKTGTLSLKYKWEQCPIVADDTVWFERGRIIYDAVVQYCSNIHNRAQR